jgi:hypothetical protein
MRAKDLETLTKYFETASAVIHNILEEGNLDSEPLIFENLVPIWYVIKGCISDRCQFITTGASNFELISNFFFSQFPLLERLVIIKGYNSERRMIRIYEVSPYVYNKQTDQILERKNKINIDQLNKLEYGEDSKLQNGQGWKSYAGGTIKSPYAGSKLTNKALWKFLGK